MRYYSEDGQEFGRSSGRPDERAFRELIEFIAERRHRHPGLHHPVRGAKNRDGKTGKGNPYLKGVLGEIAAAAARPVSER